MRKGRYDKNGETPAELRYFAKYTISVTVIANGTGQNRLGTTNSGPGFGANCSLY